MAEGLELVEEEEGGGWMFQGAGEKEVVRPEEGYSVERGACTLGQRTILKRLQIAEMRGVYRRSNSQPPCRTCA